MCDDFRPPKRSWPEKFGHAFHGIRLGVRGQSSFAVHFVVGSLVVLAAAVLGADLLQWCVLLLCITFVLTAEMFNSALEQLAKAVDRSENQFIAVALDIGSAAVLTAAIGASVVGSIVFLRCLVDWIQSM
jgi:diacylglycerol kinase